MRAKTEQPHLTGDNYKLWARQMPRPSASRQPASLPARCTRICGLFPPLAYERSPRKSWQKVKGTINFPRQNSKNDGDRWLTRKTSAIKAISINKSSKILACHFWKLQAHDQGEQNNDAVMTALQSSLPVFLPGSATHSPPALPRCPFSLNHSAAFPTNVQGKLTVDLKTHSSLFSQWCISPGSICSQAKFSVEVLA